MATNDDGGDDDEDSDDDDDDDNDGVGDDDGGRSVCLRAFGMGNQLPTNIYNFAVFGF